MTTREDDIRASCDIIFRAHYAALAHFAWRRLRNAETAADIVQTAFERIFQQRSLPEIAHLRAYLYKIVANLCNDWLKKRNNHNTPERSSQIYQALYEERETNVATPETHALDRELRRLLEFGTSQLPPRCRMAFTLTELHGKTVREASREMDISEMAVYQLVNRSYAHLAERLAHYGWKK